MMGDPSLILFVGGAGWTLFALAAAFVLRRGRKLNDHPSCAKCGHDLFGLPPTTTRCPECGADLGGRGAVVAGVYERRSVRRASPRVMLVAGVAAAVAGLWNLAYDDRYNAYKPSWFLAMYRERNDVLPFARSELLRRAQAGSLGWPTTGILARRAAAKAASPGGLEPTLLATVEALRASGRLADDDWVAYARAMPRVDLRTRSAVCPGDPIAVELRPVMGFAGARTCLVARVTRATAALDGATKFDLVFTGGTRLEPVVKAVVPASMTPALPPGDHALDVAVTMELFEGGRSLGEVVANAAKPIRFAPFDQDPLRPGEDADLQATLGGWLSSAVVCYDGSVAAVRFAPPRNPDIAMLSVPPAYHELILRQGGREASLGAIDSEVLTGALRTPVGVPVAGLVTGEPVELILRPKRELAVRSMFVSVFDAREITATRPLVPANPPPTSAPAGAAMPP
jgi:hypothetical protein